MALASARETEEGSLRKEEAVFMAACFSAQVVPVDDEEAEAGGSEAVVERLEKRDERPEREGLVLSLLPVAAVDSSAHGLSDAGVGEEVFPMPSPGTFTPAELNLLNAPSWVAKMSCLAAGGGGRFCWPHPCCSCVAVAYVGGGSTGAVCKGFEFCLGGRRGGRLSFGGFVTEAGLVGLFASAVALPSRCTGGLGKFEVFGPVLSALWGRGGGAGL